MLTGTRRKEQFEYISDRDEHSTEADGATIFVLASLTVDTRTKLQDGMMGFSPTGAAGFTMNTTRQHLEAVRYGLKDVRNFHDEDGGLIAFETEKMIVGGEEIVCVSDNFLSTFPNWLINELGQKLMEANSVSGKERKKSNTQS